MRIVICFVSMLIPAALLAVAGYRADDDSKLWLYGGAGGAALVMGLGAAASRAKLTALSRWVVAVDAPAAALLWYFTRNQTGDWFAPLALAVLALVPVGFLAGYTLSHSNAFPFRHAHQLAKRLMERKHWPADLHACRDLPDLKAFREALRYDVTPALEMLRHPRPEVRIASLAAMEYRQNWRPGQAETIIAVLRKEKVPEVRVAALVALANVNERALVEMIIPSLQDPELHVRRAAASALIWDTDRRWGWLSPGVRRALSDPTLEQDEPLLPAGHHLSSEAVNDLTAWAAQKGVLGVRAVQTLSIHYTQVFNDDPEQAVTVLRRLVHDVHAPPLLRIEMARLLQQNKALDPKMLESLLDTANPAPLRLIGAEALLTAGATSRAMHTLKEIAHLPNRELALATASIVQRCLNVDLGLGLNQPLPPLNSPKAVETIRKLMAWSAKVERESEEMGQVERVEPAGGMAN